MKDVNFPSVLFLPSRDVNLLSGTFKFILAKVPDYFIVVISQGGHSDINQNFTEFLQRNNYIGEYQVHGGGLIHIEKDCIEAEGSSDWFGTFNGSQAEECLKQAWPERKVLTARTKPNRITRFKITKEGPKFLGF